MKRILFSVLLGYVIGSINPSYIFGKMRGIDIRQEGSGNAVLLMGKATGAICAVLDILKAYLIYCLAEFICPDIPAAGILAGTACIMGHMFPVWMNFRGGKGLACLGGLIFAYNPKVFCVMLLAEIVLVLIVDYICAVAISASVIFPVIYTFYGGALIGSIALITVAVLMLYKHLENIKRIQQGKEARVSYLWNKEQETERLRANYD